MTNLETKIWNLYVTEVYERMYYAKRSYEGKVHDGKLEAYRTVLNEMGFENAVIDKVNAEIKRLRESKNEARVQYIHALRQYETAKAKFDAMPERIEIQAVLVNPELLIVTK